MREYYKAPEAAAKDLGLTAAFFDGGGDFELWKVNEKPFVLFLDMSTQWLTGPGGVVGLNYMCFFHELDRKGVKDPEYSRIMDSIRVIEDEAIRQLYKKD